MMESKDAKNSCLERIKNNAGGMHACYFYESLENLLDVLLPYFAEGLANNEFCLWVCPQLIQAEEAKTVFIERLPLPHPEKYFRSGQIEIRDAAQWYIEPATRRFRPEITLQQARALYSDVMQKDFAGLRASGDISWLADDIWSVFMEYEQNINQFIANYNVRTICSYPLSRCGPREIMDVVSRHQLSILSTPSGIKFTEYPEHSPAATPDNPSDVSIGSLHNLTGTVLEAREEERKNISTNLHSSIGSLAVSLSSKLQSVEKEIKTRNHKEALLNLCEANTILKSEVHRIKNLAYSIRPPELDLGGFAEAVESHLPNIAKEKNVDFRFHCDPACNALSLNEATVLFRIAHEALINMLKHARAKTMEIRLSRKADKIRMSIRDDGCGFDPEKTFNQPHHTVGLFSMKEMTESLGGTFSIQSAPAKGTRIEVLLPKNNP